MRKGEEMQTCKICGQDFKKITASHLKSHKITFDEYLKKYEKEQYSEKELIKFLNNFYITVKYRFLQYSNGQAYTITKGENRSWGLCDSDIKEHLQGSKTIGIYFPKDYTNLIAFDIDIEDIDLLNKLYSTLINYGISEKNLLLSSSGKKGYHVDIFLSSMIDKSVVNKFYEVILSDLKVSKKEIELRGGGNQGYKLPLGYHHKTGNHCYICNEWGKEESKLHKKIKSIRKLDVSVIGEIVDINYIESADIDLIIQYEELDSTVKMLPIYQNTNDNRIVQVEKLINNGLKEIGQRHISIREISAYCKDVKGFCIAETMEFINNWIANKWTKDIIDKEILAEVKSTVKSVYSTGYKFNISANRITITLPEIREIFSLTTNNKLQTDALRKLYYMYFIHSKAYADTEGIFYLTYSQLIEMGARKNKEQLASHISKLEELGKLIIIQRNVDIEHTFKKAPNKYKLPAFITYEKELKSFALCNKGTLCKDCLYKALCYLADDKERRKHIKGTDYKKLEECPYNK